jgi:DNA repair photolyase
MPRRVSNPPNPWSSTHVEWLDEPPQARLEVYEEQARSVLVDNASPDVPFRWSVNPYRGCQHACAYCYARPTHQYLGFGAGTDFDSKIVVKRNAPEALRKKLASRSWKGEWIAFSGVTDCYQPLEASYELTRQCLQACLEFQNPVGVITKSALVRRDVDLLLRFQRFSDPHVYLSIPFADDGMGRLVEPAVTSVTKRFETLRVLSEAGLTTGVALAPLIPGLNDAQIPEILERAREAGVRHAFMILLRLTREVRPIFEERLRANFPDRADKVLHALDEMRADQRGPAEFGQRMHGLGPRWQNAFDLFELHKRRLGFEDVAVETPAPDKLPDPRRVTTHQPDLFA